MYEAAYCSVYISTLTLISGIQGQCAAPQHGYQAFGLIDLTIYFQVNECR